jgi:hypothetical protein
VSGALNVSRSLAYALVLILPLASAVSQSTPDRHVNSPSRALYHKSSYAHGYMHGYEEGFHNGDLDIHMGRGERPLTQVRGYHDCAGYRNEFGDKQFFKLGYKQGFREGYADAVSGRSFRAIAVARRISEGVPESEGLPERDFDSAFARGYDTGRDVGSAAEADQVDESYTNRVCASRLPRSEAKYQAALCDAFARGFLLGFSDGHVNRVATGTETARNAEAGKQ